MFIVAHSCRCQWKLVRQSVAMYILSMRQDIIITWHVAGHIKQPLLYYSYLIQHYIHQPCLIVHVCSGVLCKSISLCPSSRHYQKQPVNIMFTCFIMEVEILKSCTCVSHFMLTRHTVRLLVLQNIVLRSMQYITHPLCLRLCADGYYNKWRNLFFKMKGDIGMVQSTKQERTRGHFTADTHKST